MINKKGQLGNLQGIILTLIIVGILIGAAFFILDEFLDQADNISASVNNESGAFVNTTGYTIDAVTDTGFNSPIVSSVFANVTGDAYLIPSSNYTLSSAGILTNNSAIPNATEYNDANISYSYLRGGSAFVGVNSTIIAMLTIPNLLGLVVLIAMIGIILAVVFNVIPGARVSGA